MVIALIVIACIILLFVLLFTVRAYITIDLHDEFALSVKVLGIPLHILPQKQKKYNPRHYTLKKIRKRDAKEAKRQARLAAKKAKKDAEKAKEKAALDKLTKAQRKALKKEKRAIRRFSLSYRLSNF
jgi:biopolymer transport protein ExbB/TolQ